MTDVRAYGSTLQSGVTEVPNAAPGDVLTVDTSGKLEPLPPITVVANGTSGVMLETGATGVPNVAAGDVLSVDVNGKLTSSSPASVVASGGGSTGTDSVAQWMGWANL